MMETSRGGYRYNAGRKSQWKTGETKAIKLPVRLIPRLLEIAKILDEGGEVLEIRRDFGQGGTPPEGLIRWNVYTRVQGYDRKKQEPYWNEWELKASHLTEAEAQQTVKWKKEANWRYETYGDHVHLNIQYDIRCERIIPATVPQPKPDDAVLGGQGSD